MRFRRPFIIPRRRKIYSVSLSIATKWSITWYNFHTILGVELANGFRCIKAMIRNTVVIYDLYRRVDYLGDLTQADI